MLGRLSWSPQARERQLLKTRGVLTLVCSSVLVSGSGDGALQLVEISKALFDAPVRLCPLCHGSSQVLIRGMFVPQVILEDLSLDSPVFPLGYQTSFCCLLLSHFFSLQSLNGVKATSIGTTVLLSCSACELVCSAFDFLLSTLKSPHWGISALSKPIEWFLLPCSLLSVR